MGRREPRKIQGAKNGYRTAGRHKTGTGRRLIAEGKKAGLLGAWLCPWLFCLLSSKSGWSSYLRMVLLAPKPLLTSCLASYTPS